MISLHIAVGAAHAPKVGRRRGRPVQAQPLGGILAADRGALQRRARHDARAALRVQERRARHNLVNEL